MSTVWSASPANLLGPLAVFGYFNSQPLSRALWTSLEISMQPGVACYVWEGPDTCDTWPRRLASARGRAETMLGRKEAGK